MEEIHRLFVVTHSEEDAVKRTIVAVIGLLAVSLVGFGCSGENPARSDGEDQTLLPAAKKGGNGKNSGCAFIQDGLLTYTTGHYLAGEPLIAGYDAYGYNYQAHLFNGSYANVYLGDAGFPPYEGDDTAYLTDHPTAAAHWAWPYRDVALGMKWNEAWISNQDCDADGKLDRHFGFDSYIGSGAWETNHMRGVDELDDATCKWNYFVKIVAAPADASSAPADTPSADDTWYNAEGTEIGPVIWGEFAILQEISNDACNGDHGVQYRSPAGPGFGKYKP